MALMVYGVVYAYVRKATGEIEYVGKCAGFYGYASALRQRHNVHMKANRSPFDRLLVMYPPDTFVTLVLATVAGDRTLAIRATLNCMEAFLIAHHLPRYNVIRPRLRH